MYDSLSVSVESVAGLALSLDEDEAGPLQSLADDDKAGLDPDSESSRAHFVGALKKSVIFWDVISKTRVDAVRACALV